MKKHNTSPEATEAFAQQGQYLPTAQEQLDMVLCIMDDLGSTADTSFGSAFDRCRKAGFDIIENIDGIFAPVNEESVIRYEALTGAIFDRIDGTYAINFDKITKARGI